MTERVSPEPLTPEIILDEIWEFHKEWEDENDWWWGKQKRYKDVPVGYDVNVFNDAEGEPFRAVVYQLKEEDRCGYSMSTDDVIFVFPVPTEEEYKREKMEELLKMNAFKVEKRSVKELKVEALGMVLDLDFTQLLSEHAVKGTVTETSGEYSIVFAEAPRPNVYSVQVYEGRETRKPLRKEMLDMHITSDGNIVTLTGLPIFDLADALRYATENPGVVLIDASKPILHEISFNESRKRIETSNTNILTSTDATRKVWVTRPDTARTARLMVIHEASYFNGRLVSVDGKEDMLVNIGDNNITNDGTEYLVAVYRVDKEV
ncbi:MAG: hypothetical protein DRN17_06470 [Thermoplasmata archaeon]|nr:MAG: hypothetical protein DRN17_06470 [Thermoplasmata archaeon]